VAYLERAAKQRIGCNGCFLYYITLDIRYGSGIQEHNGFYLWIILLIEKSLGGQNERQY
jgi:hypothetical protein